MQILKDEQEYNQVMARIYRGVDIFMYEPETISEKTDLLVDGIDALEARKRDQQPVKLSAEDAHFAMVYAQNQTLLSVLSPRNLGLK